MFFYSSFQINCISCIECYHCILQYTHNVSFLPSFIPSVFLYSARSRKCCLSSAIKASNKSRLALIIFQDTFIKHYGVFSAVIAILRASSVLSAAIFLPQEDLKFHYGPEISTASKSYTYSASDLVSAFTSSRNSLKRL